MSAARVNDCNYYAITFITHVSFDIQTAALRERSSLYSRLYRLAAR